MLAMHYWTPLATSLLLFAALWPFSIKRRDVSIVDFAWGPGFAIQLIVAVLVLDGTGPVGWLVTGLVTVWSLRLAVTLIGRRVREGIEDPRYTDMRESWGPGFWWNSLFIVFLLQALLQWMIAIGPISILPVPNQAIGLLALLGTGIAIIGLAIETRADIELDRFKRKAGPGSLMTEGLRAYVRHPNYSGEIIFWTGIAMVGVGAGSPWALISPVLITVFLVGVSGAPLIDERLGQTRPDYAAYRARTPAFLPRLIRR